MSTIVTRAGKGSPLTHTEVDNNFTNLNTDKAEDSSVVKLTGDQTVGGTKTFSSTITGSITGNSGTATALATGRTIAVTGDLTYTSPSFDGSGNVTAAGTLATVNSNTGAFGSSSSIPVITVNGKGLITGVTTATVAGGQYFGTAASKAIAYNEDSIAENITTTAGKNCLSVGAITIASGYSVTIAAGQRWVIL
jgi:hypothetical protein